MAMKLTQYEAQRMLTRTKPHLLGISSTEKLVLLCLHDRVDAQGQCYPSQELLAEDTGLSKRSIVRALKTLVEKGYVAVKREASHGMYPSNKYHVDIDKILDVGLEK
ncbi:helix-turn-helix domain-containing protein [Vibrio breoganii]